MGARPVNVGLCARLAGIVCLLSLVPGLQSHAQEAAAAHFVGRSGTTLVLDGAPFRFVGVNIYNAAGDPNINECGPPLADPDHELADWFGRVREQAGASVVRLWAFQSYTAAGTNWQALDRVVRVANQTGVKLIPVLDDQWGACTRNPPKSSDWYADGYHHPYGADALAYEEYVRRVVARYRDEPGILAWMLMNEAESADSSGASQPDALWQFADTMSGQIKRLDPHHLVFLGIAGGDHPGVAGHLRSLQELENIDGLSFHDYGHDDEPLPGLIGDGAAALSVEFFTQDLGWLWTAQNLGAQHVRTWQTVAGMIPSGGTPFQRIGLNFQGVSDGDIFVDDVQIGARTYDFEDGTSDDWSAAGATLSNAQPIANSGNHALRISHPSFSRAFQVWAPGTAEDAPGTAVTFRVYLDLAASSYLPDSLAASLALAKELDKPILVDEAGMWVCTSPNGEAVETLPSRAAKIDAKMDAFFRSGGAGYLVWAWHPTSDCSTDFTSGDPLNAVLSSTADALRGTP
jgi:Cellulase (glycosyl hydrolase family 5)